MAISGSLASGVLPATTTISRPKSALPGCSVFGGGGGGRGMRLGLTTIECSSRPQKKATAHHRKTRPRKSQLWDIRRGPAVYPPLPQLPPDWTLVSSSQEPQQQRQEEEVEGSLTTASSPSD